MIGIFLIEQISVDGIGGGRPSSSLWDHGTAGAILRAKTKIGFVAMDTMLWSMSPHPLICL